MQLEDWPREILIASLLVQNPAAAVEHKEIAAEPAPAGVSRPRSRRRLASASATALPEEILVLEIFVRLPAKHILRCRAVCRYWCRLTSAPDFIRAHHRRQPSLLLHTLYLPSTYQRSYDFPVLCGTSSRDPILDNGLTSTPKFILAHRQPERQRGRPVLGLDDHITLHIHASCDGLLVLSLSGGRFCICNPATHQCAPLPCLTAATGRVALYLHRPSAEYRLLYNLQGAYYILAARRRLSPRRIGVPSGTPGIEKAILAAWRETTTTSSTQPVVFRSCLHWHPSSVAAGILVFDTVAESFRLMSGPADATTLCTRLCHMEDSIGFSCFGSDDKTVIKIWVLEDYEREVWSFKYRVKLPVEWLPDSGDTQHFVLSHKGDVLVCFSFGYMFHLDNTGKMLEKFRCNSSRSLSLIGPWFKESLVKHDFSLRRGCAWVRQLHFF